MTECCLREYSKLENVKVLFVWKMSRFRLFQRFRKFSKKNVSKPARRLLEKIEKVLY